MERSDLIGVASEPEKAHLGDQIPQYDIRVFRTACEAHTPVVEGQLGDGGLVTIEGDDYRRRSRVPNPNSAIFVARRQESVRNIQLHDRKYLPNGEDILIGLALRDHSHLSLARRIAPSSEQLALLDIPAQDLFTSADNRSSSAGLAHTAGSMLVFGPYHVR